MKTVILILSLFIFGMTPYYAHAEKEPVVFSTWEGFEVDKCASIWLIKRFVDQEAVIKLFPKDEDIKEGIPFDTPDAEIRRYHNISTFEFILKRYKLKDPALIHIGRIVHDVEINVWEKKVLDETPAVQGVVQEIISGSESSGETIKKSLEYFDLLYKEINKDLK